MKNWLVGIGILTFVFLVFAYATFSKSSLVRVYSTSMYSVEKQRMISEEATGRVVRLQHFYLLET